MSETMKRRDFLSKTLAGTALAVSAAAIPTQAARDTEPKAEFRNKQDGMAYRRLGRTGYMVSEVVMGGNTISPTNFKHVEFAIERGLNYLDTSPAYGKGRSEKGYGEVVGRSSMREKVFLNSKVSVFDNSRNEFYQKLYDSLDDGEKKKVDGEIHEMLERRRILKTPYFGPYFKGQINEVLKSYLSNVMEKHYGEKIDRRKVYYDHIISSAEESLKRLKTDYLDLFMCPHGANSPEEVRIPEVYEAMDKLKRDGKIRFVGLSAHADSAGILSAAIETGMYDAAMVGYNVMNGDFVDSAICSAWEHDVGVIAMKVARAVYPNRKPKVKVPKSRLDKLNHAIPGRMSTPKKAYLWALQNPNIACVNSDMSSEELVRDNLPLAGQKVKLVPPEDIKKIKYLDGEHEYY